ncbi:hypothetical protein BDB00DRAFT_877516 [Zychaea mexicana]|uniref:uncharacterized protein n=1 Tax=Zychaea mexicana TaxID=64656 RepID=UPI0022FDD231|nr:uncharacterized protein BDB00DRAFT_877516 [Zychaea mexicana]KAI9488352.1 hypothetical protein BDB00DRAFT_877516 [Zychaea mexicana]
MNNITWTSLLGLVAVITMMLIAIVLAGIDAPNHTDCYKDNVIWDGFLVALATMSFSFGANVFYPNMEGSMQNLKRWPIVLTGALSLCAALCIAIAVCGYYITAPMLPAVRSTSMFPSSPANIVAIVLTTINSVVSAPILLVSFALHRRQRRAQH